MTISGFIPNSKERGQAVIELLVTLAVAGIFLPGLITGLVASREGSAQQEQRLEAIALMRETTEALRVVREAGWTSFAVNGIFHPEVSGTTWVLVADNETINGFTRFVEISDVMRDSSGSIVPNNGIVDPSTKQATITVSWETPQPSSVASTIYLTRYLENETFIDTTVEDFETGTHNGTHVTNTSGGEVTLGAGGGGSWCAPNLTIQALDLPKNGVANAISAIEGKVFAGTGENASGVSYASVDISNTNPPDALIEGTFSGYKTNDIFGEENYAYLATDTNSKEVVIIDISNTPYTEAGYFDAPGNGDGFGVFVYGNTGFMTNGSTLYSFDLTSKSGSRPQLGSVNLSGTGNRIYVLDNYVYVSNSGSTQLQIIEISNNGNTLTPVGNAQVNGGSGKDIFINSTGTRAYLATEASVSQNELFIIDITTKIGTRPVVGSYDTNGMDPKGIRIVPGNHAIIVGIGGQEYQVVDISNEASPSNCGGLNIDSGVNGVAAVLEEDGDAYSYIITGDSTSELKIIEGGPGGQYSGEGVYESAAFDGGPTAVFNRIIPNFIRPPETTIQLQVAVAQAAAGSCTSANYNFLGPDGTDATFFTGEGVIPFITNGLGYTNPGQCFKYRAYFDTRDQFSSPILTDVSVNYSP